MKHNYLKSLFLMLMMCVGMSAWAADADYTLTPTNGSNNTYTGNCDVTVGDITWNVTGNASMVPWRLGGKSITNVDRTVYSKTAYSSAVSKVDLTVGAASSITVNSLKLVYSTNADFSNSSEISKSFAANSTISFEGDFPANTYYKFVFNVTVSGSSNKFVEFSKVEFYNVAGSDPAQKYNVTIADDIANGTVSATPTSASAGATVTLTATPANGYEFGSWNVTNASTSEAISVTDNKFTMPASNVNVSATFNEVQVVARPENEIFYESFDTNNGTGGNDDLWSGSIASSTFYSDKEWTSENSSGANKCAKFGTGSKLGSATTPALGIACNATLTFKAAAWNGSSENTTLKLSLVGGGTIETKTVTLVKGEWTTYVVSLKNLTKTSKIKFEGEKASNSRFFLDEVSVVMTEEIVPPADKELISIQADGTPAEFWKGDAFNHNGITVTALWDDDSKTDVTSLCTFSTPDMSAAGEKTVTITYLGEECSYHINVQTIANTQETAYTTAQAIALIDAGKDLDTEVYITGVVSKVDSYNDKYKSITYWLNDDSFEIYGGLAAKDEEFSSIDDIEVGATVVVLGKIANYKGTYEVNSNNHLVSYVAPVHETATITLNDACHDADGMVYGTYSNASAWVVPSDLEVSVIAVVDGSLFVEAFNTGDVVPANTGVMVSAMEGGDYTITLSNKYGVDPLEGAYENALRPSGDGITAESMAAATTNCTYYRLTMHNGTQIGFAWGAAEGAAFNLAANKAYLAVPKSASVKSLVWFTGEEDAIKGVEQKTLDTVIYDMQGRKVSKTQKGLYIINGRKMVK